MLENGIRAGHAHPRVNSEAEPQLLITTRWSLVLAGASTAADHEAIEALATLCRTYWRPVFSYIYRRGYSPEDAEDLAQDFFHMILKTNWLRHADPGRGRFRSLLLKSIQNFLSNADEKKRTLKRGGRVEFISWDAWLAELPSETANPLAISEAIPPERLFDLRWAETVVEQALRRLREECEDKERLHLFETLRDYLMADRSEISYRRLASSLGVGEEVVRKQLHNLRERYRWLLRNEVEQTVGQPEDVDDEIGYLCAVLAAGEW